MNYIQLFLLLLITQIGNACPTCIGRLDKNMPPFFSAEFDEHYHAYSKADEAPDTDAATEGEEA